MLARILAMGLAAALLGCSATSHAQQDADRDTLRLDVAGTIPPRCGISFIESRLQLDLAAPTGSVRLPFSVDCNDRMSVQLRSRSGAMMHERSATLVPSPGFGFEQPYRLVLAIGAMGRSRFYESRDLFAAPAMFETAIIPGQTTGQLSVSWNRTEPLLGGRYHDVIEIRVSAAGETDERG